ncbi:MAG: RHS repeat protein [Acidobacteria bacterium]|nr:RHS repeat protein [Acidobacteriota bacterium]
MTNTVVWGLNGRQWTAAFLICLLLLPLLTTPAGAFEPAGGAFRESPVNEHTGFWRSVWRDLNVGLEEWTTPWRFANRQTGENEGDGKIRTPKDENRAEKAGKNDVGPRLEEPKDAKPVDQKTADAPKTDKEPAAPVLKPVVENKSSIAAPLIRFDQLPADERNSVYSYGNNLGSPFGQVEKDSSNQAAALRIQHRTGIANYNFNIPLASLSGRGIDAGVGLSYNSRTWNLSCGEYSAQGCGQKHFTYDVEQSWIAPGFSTGFGYLESNATPNGGVYKIIPQGITDADGTRHQLHCKTFAGTTCAAFETDDGTFIRTGAEAAIPNLDQYAGTSFTAVYPNGVRVYYAGAFGGGTERRHYPVVIQDSNGNRIRVAYRADQSGRIDYVVDTLNRKIKFYYENDANGSPDKLVAVTIPGLSENSEIQTARFYYQNLTLNAAGKFNGQITAPVSIRVLQYVFIPATRSGYKFEYDANFGMIRKITRQVGMTAGTTSLNTTGTLSEGVMAASTEYNYPDGSTVLNDVPKYSRRTDDWQGRTSSAPQITEYNTPEPATGSDLVSQITVKDNGFDVRTENRSFNTTDWQNGLLKETTVTRVGSGTFSEKLLSKTVYGWVQGTDAANGRRNPRLRKLDVTNEAGLVKTTEFEYDQYNNQTRIKEYDYGVNAPLLRTTEIEYESGAGWINANLLHLQKSQKLIVNNAVVGQTIFEYDHNGSDASLVRRADIDIRTHDTFYNPDQPAWEETVCPDGSAPAPNALPGRCTIIRHPGYSGASAFRGNLTRVTKSKDGVLISDLNAVSNDFEYDIAGNSVTETLSCCNLKTIAYEKSSEYAFPVSETKGSGSLQLTVAQTYNRNTGLILTKTDENDQVTGYEYEPDTLRLRKIAYPNGGSVLTEYGDKLVTDPNDRLPGFIRLTSTLDTGRNIQSYQYFNGRGDEIRKAVQTPDGWTVTAMEFDKFGRPVKSFNPFFGATPTVPIPAGTRFTEILNYDALGRTTAVRLPDNSTISTEYGDTDTTPAGFNRTFLVATDQAGKKRRLVLDALGRVVRADEPDSDGLLGDMTTPRQPTFYEYDGNDNLIKVTQTEGNTTQERLFRYDSLSRLTHEKQVEATATLNDDGVKQSGGGSWTKVLKYDDDGLLQDSFDANGVRTHFAYDGLNRVVSVVFSGGNGFQTPAINYTYDEARAGFYNKGRLTRVATAAVEGAQATPATEQIYDFDRMGQVVKQQQRIDSQEFSLEYAYNLAGQLVSEKYPSGRVVNVGYDAGGRLSSVGDSQRNYLNGIGFNAQTLPNQMNYGNGTTQKLSFNDRLQMISQELDRGAETLQKYDYGYGEPDSNNVLKNTGKLERITNYIGTEKQWTQQFSYDPVGRLTEAREYRGDTGGLSYKQRFDYDRFGN